METRLKENLSARETQIARMAAEGLTDKEIAHRAGVSITTIRTYWMRIRRKVGASNRAQAIVLALDSNRQTPCPPALGDQLMGADVLGVVAIAADGEVLAANNSFLNMVGHDRKSFEKDGLQWDDLVIENPIIHNEKEGLSELPPQEGLLRHRDGHEVPVLATGTTITDHEGVDVSCVVDLSDTKSDSPSQSKA